MKDVLTDIFNRSLAPLSSGQHACLRVEQVSAVEDNQTLKTPVGTALIVGVDGQRKEPIAILGVTSPKLSANTPALGNARGTSGSNRPGSATEATSPIA